MNIDGQIFERKFSRNLLLVAKNATLRRIAVKGTDCMTAVRGQRNLQDPDSVFDDAEALIALAQSSFTEAARAEVEKNDRLGIPTHGSNGGKLVVRQPLKAPSQP